MIDALQLAAKFGPVLKEYLPDRTPIERMKLADALAALSPQALPAPGEVERKQFSHDERASALARTLAGVATEAREEHGEWMWREIATAAMNILWCAPGQSLATVAAANDEGVWQDIEIAPRDGTLFLALYRDNGLFVYALTHYRRNRDGTEGWYDGTIPAANPPLAWRQLPDIAAAIRLLSQGEGK